MKLPIFLLTRLAALRSWFGSMSRRRHFESEMDAELAAHLEYRAAHLIRSGLPAEEAARRARLELGNVLTHKEGMRAARGLRWFDELRADVRYAVRLLRKCPGFTAVAATSLALAIGANTAIFSLAKSLLYDRLQVPHPEELRMLRWTGSQDLLGHSAWGDFDNVPGVGTTSRVFSYPVYRILREYPAGTSGLAAFKEDNMNATVRGTARRVNVAMVSGNYYDVLEVHPQLGRAILPADNAVESAGSAAVISDALWDRDFGRSPNAIGQIITVNQQKLTIVGVNPARFTGTQNVLESPDIFVPISLEPVLRAQHQKVSDLNNPDFLWVYIVTRVNSGVSLNKVQAELATRFEVAVRSLSTTIKAGDTVPHLELSEGSRGLHFFDGMYGKPLYVLLALTGFVLLLACANVANLLLARGAQRQREMSVRLALGAGRARVARQLLTESLLLAVLGGSGGLLLGYFSRNVLPRQLSNSWEGPGIRVSFDWGVFACTTVVILATGVLFGLAPAWFAARTQVSSSLKETGQNLTRRRRGLSGKALVGLQIALSTLLVVGAGLFLRTLTALNTQKVGFGTDHLLLFSINPPAARYPAGKDIALHQELERRFSALPGVQHVSGAMTPYLTGWMSNQEFFPEGEAFNKQKHQAEYFNVVGSDFFASLGIPIISGRGFGAQDTVTSPKVGVINQALAKKRFPNTNPIGKHFRMSDDQKGPLFQIIGISADTVYDSLRQQPPPQFFLLYTQRPDVGGITYEVRTSLGPTAIEPLLLRTVQSVDRDLPITDLRTQRQQINATLQVERMLAALTSGFGLLALALACVGIYGIMAYSVSQRTNEIGIRLALGAQPGNVRRMVLRESTVITIIGIFVGVSGALGLSRLVKSMLYGVVPYDPVTLGSGVVLLLTVALAASWIPARRAAGVEPMQALRHE